MPDFRRSWSLSPWMGVALLFHPLWIPLYLGLVAWTSGLPALERYPVRFRMWYMLALTLTVVLMPLAGIAWMKRQGMVSSWEVPRADQRKGPYVLQLFCLALMYVLCYKLDLSPWLTRPLWLTAALVLWALAWLRHTKISAHAMGMGALSSTLIMCYSQGASWSAWPLLPSVWPSVGILLSGLVLTARYQQMAHTLGELIHGWLAGLLVFGWGMYDLTAYS